MAKPPREIALYFEKYEPRLAPSSIDALLDFARNGDPPNLLEYRLVRQKRTPIAWVIKDKDGRYLYDPIESEWSTELFIAMRFRTKREAEIIIERLDDDLRAVPVALVRKGAK